MGANRAWEDQCGYKSSEVVQKPLFDVIRRSSDGKCGDLERAIEQLAKDADQIKSIDVDFRNDDVLFNRVLTFGPLFDDAEGFNEEGKKEPSYFVGILRCVQKLVEI